MGFINKVREMMNVPDDEYDEMENEEYVEGEEYYEEEYEQPATSSEKLYVAKPSNAKAEMTVIKPTQYEEARNAANHVNAKHIVVLNLESASKETSRRILDFLSGVAYANESNVQRCTSTLFLIVPKGVNSDGDLLEQFESSDVLF